MKNLAKKWRTSENYAPHHGFVHHGLVLAFMGGEGEHFNFYAYKSGKRVVPTMISTGAHSEEVLLKAFEQLAEICEWKNEEEYSQEELQQIAEKFAEIFSQHFNPDLLVPWWVSMNRALANYVEVVKKIDRSGM